jgi:ribonuclease BN (tRNA processing enzyme)
LELPPDTTSVVGLLRVTPTPVIHFCEAPAYGLRVECDGRTIAYSGDTEWTDDLLRIASGADLFICEAYFFEKKIKYHLDYTTLVARRAELECKRLVITHMNEDIVGHIRELEVEYAEDGKIISI